MYAKVFTPERGIIVCSVLIFGIAVAGLIALMYQAIYGRAEPPPEPEKPAQNVPAVDLCVEVMGRDRCVTIKAKRPRGGTNDARRNAARIAMD